MIGLFNPWVILAGLLALAGAGTFGYSMGVDSVQADLYEAQQARDADAAEHQTQINAVATAYGKAYLDADDAAHTLRREVNENRNQLADCSGRFALLNSQFVRLRNDALQLRTKARDPAEPADPTAGTGSVTPEEVLENDIENGRRWKHCRDQLNALIEVVK